MDLDSPGYPARRPRRLRSSVAMRRLVAETRLSVDDLVAPLFVREGIDRPRPIDSLPGVVQHTRDSLRAEAVALAELGVPALILFGVPQHKDATGSGAWDPEGIVQLAIADLVAEVGDSMVIMADLCLDEYTDHGHCGVVDGVGSVDNDATLGLYRRVARAQAAAGVDVVAPSGMMDGQVAAIRGALDSDGAGEVAICAYSAKYASAFYGPFRDAVDVTIADGGDRRGYQQDPANAREALEEVRLDAAEGADMVMVKPAITYLDVIAAVRAEVDLPVAAYQVSGEYAALHAAAQRGWLDLDAAALEQLLAIRRAGADVILTYFARRVAERFAQERR
ncbi:MAG: porphobilinogen synthase [Microthrixaceae bacterium]